MWYVVVLFAILFVIAIIYIYLLRKNQNYINQQLQFILEHETNAIIFTRLHDQTTKKTLSLINQTIEKKKEVERKSIILEGNLRTLINNVTHDLRTPLTVAKGYLQMAKRENVDSKTKDDYMIKTSNSLNKLTERINILFEYTKLQEQKDSFQFERINLSNTLKEQILLFYQQFNDQQFKVSLAIQKNISMYGHLPSLKSLFQNVLSNTLNHGKDEVSIHLHKENKKIVFECRNKTKEQQIDVDAIFERFYTEDMSRNQQNTGLGMPIIRDLALLHFGDVIVKFEHLEFDLTIIFEIR